MENGQMQNSFAAILMVSFIWLLFLPPIPIYTLCVLLEYLVHCGKTFILIVNRFLIIWFKRKAKQQLQKLGHC